jgi:hypothetical protein
MIDKIKALITNFIILLIGEDYLNFYLIFKMFIIY